jgi:hypothetical protein
MPEIQMGLDFKVAPREQDHAWFNLLEPKIVADFWAFHAKYPQVYTLFHKYAAEAKDAGRTRFGIGMIAERVRWYMSVETTGTADEDFKINNNLRSCYARLLMIRVPEFEGLFELRSSTVSED